MSAGRASARGRDPGRFAFESWPTRVRFGEGERARLAEEAERLGAARVLVIASRRHAAVVDGLRASAADLRVIDDIRQHVPADRADAACALAAAHGSDTVVAVGGGSAIGLAKAVARQRPVRIIAVPTTYSGSEMTPIWGLTAAGGKQTGHDPAVLPSVVVYDPGLTRSLPPSLAASSGLNAVAHAAEALYAPGRNPITDLLAVDALVRLAAALPVVVGDTDHASARAEALHGACLAGMALGQVGTSLHHKACHVLGGRFGLPHAETHAVLLPHSVRIAAERYPAAGAAIAEALGADDAPGGVAALARDLGAPSSLRELGLGEADRDEAVAAVSAVLGASGIEHPADRAAALVRAAYDGSSRSGGC